MTVPLPSSVKVGPYVYRVVCDWEEYARLGSDPDLFGQTEHKSLTITLNPRLAHLSMTDTLWHEVKHAVCRSAGWRESERLDEESAVERMTALELATLRDNPDLVAFLLAEDAA